MELEMIHSFFAVCAYMISSTTAQCLDANPECIGWALRGDCSNNSPSVQRVCPCACNDVDRLRELRDLSRNSRFGRNLIGGLNSDNQIEQSDHDCPVQDTEKSGRQRISSDDIRRSNGAFLCAPVTLSTNDCRSKLDACYHRKFRTQDGVCNNLVQSTLGSANQPYLRLLSSDYDDRVERSAVSNKPSARELSRLLLASDIDNRSNRSALLLIFGQFLAHDLTKSTLLSDRACNQLCNDNTNSCANIPLSALDPTFRNQACLILSRATPPCAHTQPREQYNENTAFIDGSAVYGSSRQVLNSGIRSGRSQLLSSSGLNGHTFPPLRTNQRDFLFGDDRGNIFWGLTAIQTLFLREHNRIVEQLRTLNQHWTQDRLFEETRKIIGAEIQWITYNEFIPHLIGENATRELIGVYQSYNQSVNPSISSEFASAAFRMGHGLILPSYPLLTSDFNSLPTRPNYRLQESIQNAFSLVQFGIDPVLQGLMTVSTKRPRHVTRQLTERLFGLTDLAAVNIQRGRDHGLPGYNRYREFCGLPRVVSFTEMANSDLTLAGQLNALYDSVDRIDLYVGGMLEQPVEGGLLGATFTCIIADQFKRLRDGDRFWLENDSIFSLEQLATLRKFSFNSILCQNSNTIRHVASVNSFDLVNLSFLLNDTTTSCDNVVKLDLTKWHDI